MSQALYRKWRPQTWQDVVGQTHVTQTLQNAIQSGRLVHAYLFAGPRGTGKTSTARLLAKAVNCTDPQPSNRPCNHCEICNAINESRFLDLIEIDAASNTSVDDIRDLRDKIRFSPSMGQYKVYIIDEVHMLSMSAFNALLKTLEEPPSHAIFVLATTEIHKIPATVLSRCQRHEFRRISINNIVEELEKIVAGENLKIDKNVLTLVARQSTGAMRDAISLLDQLASSGENVTLEYAHNILGTATNQSVIQVIDDILTLQTAKGLEHIHTALDSGIDPRQYSRQIVEYLRNILLVKMGDPLGEDLPADIREKIETHAGQFEKEHLLFCLQRFNSTAADVRGNWQPSLSLELAFAETCISPAPKATVSCAQPVEQLVVTRTAAVQETESTPSHHSQPDVHADGSAKEPPVKTERQSTVPAETKPGAQAIAPPADQLLQSVTTEKSTGVAQDEKAVFRKLRDNWSEIKKQVRQANPQTEGLLNSCRPFAVKENVIQLATSEFVKSKVETKENLAIIEPVISRMVGEEVSVTCITLKNNPAGSKDTLQNEDGMVNAALGLGGQIIQQD